jgi:hypothetical protein
MAAVRAQRNEAPGFRSFDGETVPLKLFLENLFSEDYSTEVLQTRPGYIDHSGEGIRTCESSLQSLC